MLFTVIKRGPQSRPPMKFLRMIYLQMENGATCTRFYYDRMSTIGESLRHRPSTLLLQRNEQSCYFKHKIDTGRIAFSSNELYIIVWGTRPFAQWRV